MRPLSPATPIITATAATLSLSPPTTLVTAVEVTTTDLKPTPQQQ